MRSGGSLIRVDPSRFGPRDGLFIARPYGHRALMSQPTGDRPIARKTMIVLGLVLATAIGLLLVYEVRRVLIWILIAAFFATALNPAANWLERHISWCKRWLATLILFVAVLVVIAGLVALFVAPLVREGTQLAHQLPDLVSDAKAGRGPIGHLLQRFHVLQWIQDHRDQLQQYANGVGGTTFSVLRGAATTVAGVLTIFVLSYLMVLESPRILHASVAPFEQRLAERIRRVAGDCARTITGYITGNLLISVICGVLTYVVLLVMGVPFAGLIALFVAIADLIPLVGATLGAIVAAVAGFVHSIPAGIVVIVFFVVYQQLENHLLQPVILSRTVKLNPLTVLVSILIGVELAGILGALLAIPVAGIIQIIVRDLWDSRRGRLKTDPTVGDGHEPVSAPAADGSSSSESDTIVATPPATSDSH
jgi:predicted PurR-regulated permease PerM